MKVTGAGRSEKGESVGKGVKSEEKTIVNTEERATEEGDGSRHLK